MTVWGPEDLFPSEISENYFKKQLSEAPGNGSWGHTLNEGTSMQENLWKFSEQRASVVFEPLPSAPSQFSDTKHSLQTGGSKNTGFFSPSSQVEGFLPRRKKEQDIFLGETGHQLLSHPASAPHCQGQVMGRCSGEAWVPSSLHWWKVGCILGTIIPRILRPPSLLLRLVRQWFHVRRGQLERLQAAVPSHHCSTAEMGVLLRERVPLCPLPALSPGCRSRF